MSDYKKDGIDHKRDEIAHKTDRSKNQLPECQKKMTFKRILAWIAIVLLVGMYVLTLIFSIMDSPLATQLFYASLYCTVFIPVISWVFIMVLNLVKGQGSNGEEHKKE